MCSFSYYELLDGGGQDIIHSVPHSALLATGNKYMLRFLEEYGVGEGVEVTKHSLVRETRICFQTHFHGCWLDSVPWGLLDWEPQFFATCTSNHLEAFFTKHSKSCLARWKSLSYHDSDIFHCLCSIPLVRSKAQMSPTLKGRGLHKGVTTRRSQKLLILEDAAMFISVPWISRKL